MRESDRSLLMKHPRTKAERYGRSTKYIPQIFAESRQIGLIGGVVRQVAYAARLP